MPYVDGFVIPIPKKNLARYRSMAQKASRVWRDHGALEYYECAGDDLDTKMGTPFGKLAKLGRGDTVIFAWIVYRSRAHRDAVNAKVMKDPRILKMMKPKDHPFDLQKMTFGGFKVIVKA